MKYVIIFLLLLFIAGVGGILYFAMNDPIIHQTEVSRSIPSERFYEE